MENVMIYLEDLNSKKLYAIYILLKPNQCKLTEKFEYCLKTLISQLHCNATSNIMFIFTHARSTYFRIGDTVGPLDVVLKQLPMQMNANLITLNTQHMIYIDSDSLRYLLASTNNNNTFTSTDVSMFENSWTKSVEECALLKSFIPNAMPPEVMETLSINHSRQSIVKLAKHLAEISMFISEYVSQLEQNSLN